MVFCILRSSIIRRIWAYGWQVKLCECALKRVFPMMAVSVPKIHVLTFVSVRDPVNPTMSHNLNSFPSLTTKPTLHFLMFSPFT